MTSKFLFSVVCLSVIAAGCKKNDEGASATSGAFLKPSDFPTTGLTQLTSVEALNKLQEGSEVYDNKPEDSTPTGGSDNPNDPTNACLESQGPKAKIINKETISFDASIDLAPCLKIQAGSSTPTDAATPADAASKFEFQARFLQNVTCPGVDLSEFNGKTMKELGAEETNSGIPAALESKCGSLPAVKVFGNATIVVKFGTLDASGKIGIFNKEGGACELTKVDGGFKMNSCLSANYAVTKYTEDDGQQKEEKSLVLLEAVNVVDSTEPAAVWYNGGKFNVTVNNFTGTLLYSGAAIAPTYTLASGSDSVTGQLSATPSALELVSNPRNASNFVSKQLQRFLKKMPR